LEGISPNTAPTALEFLKRAATSTLTRYRQLLRSPVKNF